MNDTVHSVKVGIAGLDCVKHPGSIMTVGLGSCVGVALYDEMTRVAGLVHIMLPHSTISKTTIFKQGKFADSGIKALIENLEKLGANCHRLKAKMAGGAQMFILEGNEDKLRIGPRNVEAVRAELKTRNIPIISEDVGGNKGRTIEFYTDNFLMRVRTVQQGEQMI